MLSSINYPKHMFAFYPNKKHCRGSDYHNFRNCGNEIEYDYPLSFQRRKVNPGLNKAKASINAQNQNQNQIQQSKNIKIEKEDKWPLVDINEYKNYYIINAELPGFKKEDLDITYNEFDKILTLKGEYIYRPIKHEDLVLVEDVIEDNEDEDNESIETSSIITTNTTNTTNSLNEEGKSILNERKSKKSFKRSFKIKEDILPKEIHADLTDGLLTLRIPKKMKKDEKIHISIL